ncbi:MAG: hypothetical protein H6Q90_4758 [Deltaproteobacteria bacterium]|nr:hypothetical protein [Deltaproteobacteria bacterium]
MTSSSTTFAIAVAWLLAGCEHDSNVGSTVDAAQSTADSSIDGPPQSGACTPGNDRLLMNGAFVLDTQTITYVTVGGKVAGFGGPHGGDTVSFSVRSALTQDLDALGDHDVATTNMKFLEQPTGVDCSTAPAGTCNGFFALAGTFTVTQIQPRYRATFTLTDLREHHDITDQLGAPIAGTVTGCLDVQGP